MARGQAFGTLLRQSRLSAGLTQERLAERSGIGANGVAALEAGRRTAPRLTTVGLLCNALDLDADARAAMFAAARGTGATPSDRCAAHRVAPVERRHWFAVADRPVASAIGAGTGSRSLTARA